MTGKVRWSRPMFYELQILREATLTNNNNPAH